MTAPAQLLLTLGLDDQAGPEELEDATALLQRELLDLDVEDVERVPAAVAPSGAKGDMVSAGTLLVTLATSGTLTALLGTVKAWIERDNCRSARLQVGELSLDVQGLRPEQLQDVIDLAVGSGAGAVARPAQR